MSRPVWLKPQPFKVPSGPGPVALDGAGGRTDLAVVLLVGAVVAALAFAVAQTFAPMSAIQAVSLDPINLPGLKPLLTLRDAAKYIVNLPKAEQQAAGAWRGFHAARRWC